MLDSFSLNRSKLALFFALAFILADHLFGPRFAFWNAHAHTLPYAARTAVILSWAELFVNLLLLTTLSFGEMCWTIKI